MRRVRAIRRSIPTSAAIQLINSFIIYTVDYCNSLLAGQPAYQLQRVQSILNFAGRLICGSGKYDHVTPLLRDKLHWLRVLQRVQYTCCLMVYKARQGSVPAYIADFYIRVQTTECCSSLRSEKQRQTLRSKIDQFGESLFSVAGSSAWNSVGLRRLSFIH